MLSTLEHNDLNKARRALFVTSVTSIVIQNAVISDGPVAISGFEIVVSQHGIIFWLNTAIFYFLFIFIVRVIEFFYDKQSVTISKHLEKLREERASASGTPLAGNIGNPARIQEIENRISALSFLSSKLKLRQIALFWASEAVPVLVVSIVALLGISPWFLPSEIFSSVEHGLQAE